MHLSLTQPAFLTVLVFVLCHKYAVESTHVFALFSVVCYGEPLIGTCSPFMMKIASRLLPAVRRITLWVHEKERTTKCKMNSPLLTGIDAKIHWVARCRLGNYMIHDHNREETYLVPGIAKAPKPDTCVNGPSDFSRHSLHPIRTRFNSSSARPFDAWHSVASACTAALRLNLHSDALMNSSNHGHCATCFRLSFGARRGPSIVLLACCHPATNPTATTGFGRLCSPCSCRPRLAGRYPLRPTVTALSPWQLLFTPL